MLNFKQFAAGAMLGLATVSVPALADEVPAGESAPGEATTAPGTTTSSSSSASGTWLPGSWTGNVGVVSEYLFRGINNSNGAAVQGGVDWAMGNGFYAGGWASNNAGLTAGNEFDVYAGFAGTFMDFGFDLGAIYYLYTEDEEAATLTPSGEEIDYYEIYLGGSVGPVSLKVYGTNDYAGTDDEGIYATAGVTLPLTETLSFGLQAGFSAGSGVEAAFGDEYVDYSVSMTKKLKNDFAASFAVVGTDRDISPSQSDEPKVVIGVKKTFDLL